MREETRIRSAHHGARYICEEVPRGETQREDGRETERERPIVATTMNEANTFQQTSDAETAGAKGSPVQRLVDRYCSHIRKPYTLDEICEQITFYDYNAELMLQHLMLWVSTNDAISDTPGETSRKETK